MKRLSKEEKLAKEELTRTQVLNLTELEQVANYEKKISKKPALVLVILGIMCITIGLSYNSVLSTFIKSPQSSNPSSQNRENTDNTENTEHVSTMTCQYTTTSEGEGLSTTVDMTLIFNNGKLNNYTKVMNVTAMTGKEDLATRTSSQLLAAYQTFESIDVPGYKIISNAKPNGFETIVTINLKDLDRTKLNIYHDANVVTKAEFSLNDTKEMVEEKAKQLEYICK